MTRSEALVVVWQRQGVWSAAANRMRSAVLRARTTALVVTVLGAMLGTASSQVIDGDLDLGRTLAIASAVALVLASFAGSGATRRAVRDWTSVRATSEALKSAVYTYLAGVAPFADADREQFLLLRMEDVLSEAGELVKHTAGIVLAERPLPEVHDVDSYAAVRVRGQLEGYYRPRALVMASKLRWLRGIRTTLSVVAAAAAAAIGVVPSARITAWIGVLTTIVAALAAHEGAAHYEYQQTEFTRTADELERLLALRAIPAARTDEQFVEQCEGIISMQNQAWMAKLPGDSGE